MKKWNGIYRITVYTNEETIIVKSPLTAQINVTRSILSESTKAAIKLFNLAPSTRNSIFQDVYTLKPSKQKYIHVEAGYGDEKSMSMIFKGRILQAYSHKSGGQTDIITEIQAMALDVFDCQTSGTIEAGTSKREAIQQHAGDMPNVILGNMGAIDGTFKTSTTFDGNTLDCINEIVGGRAFVDNGVLNVLLENEVIDVPVPVITDSNGLLETPVRRDANLTIKTLFLPDIIVGQLLEVKSEISPNFDGQFKVIGFTHDLTFGDGMSGTRTTTVDLWILPLLPGADKMLTDEGVITGGAAPVNIVNGTDIKPAYPTSTPKWIMPCKGRISSPYGWRVHPIENKRKWHNGVDIAAPSGAVIKAPADGTVYYSGFENKWNGNTVRINHGIINGVKVESVFIHLKGINVTKNQIVKQGQQIGTVGSTGNSTGPHLHFSIYENVRGNDVDPFKYIDKTKFE